MCGSLIWKDSPSHQKYQCHTFGASQVYGLHVMFGSLIWKHSPTLNHLATFSSCFARDVSTLCAHARISWNPRVSTGKALTYAYDISRWMVYECSMPTRFMPPVQQRGRLCILPEYGILRIPRRQRHRQWRCC